MWNIDCPRRTKDFDDMSACFFGSQGTFTTFSFIFATTEKVGSLDVKVCLCRYVVVHHVCYLIPLSWAVMTKKMRSIRTALEKRF